MWRRRVIKAFVNKGCVAVGVEFDEIRIKNGENWLKEDIENGKLSFVVKDICDTNVESLGGKFDIIILKDVIEHIHVQARLSARLKDFLTPSGIIFFGFPRLQMPFGGHQQLCEKKLSKVPYFHLLPTPVYKSLLKLSGESDSNIKQLLKIKETGHKVVSKIHYLFNPIYEWKFNLKTKKQNPAIPKIPYLRDYLTTCVYYIITNEK